MPFGAEPVAGGGAVRFRLWAPGARRVELCLDEGGSSAAVLPMRPAGGGWVELRTDRAGPGSLYRYRIDGGMRVPDPASRFQPQGVHGPSQVVDPGALPGGDDGWPGRPWEEAVVYELHVGAFSPEGSFRGVERRLDHLAGLGVTAVELMPVGAFPGSRNWGYDGVLPFAPHAGYGTPDDLRALVRSAHERGLMMLLDVVYNHFGPEGNYLHLYAPGFFTERHHTPWGQALDFDGAVVRDYFVHNALYWLREFGFDGLRLDAVHAITDDSEPDILTELADRVREGVPGRAVHLVLEDDGNRARFLERRDDHRPRRYTAQWNDDFHHALHLILTGERDGCYADYTDRPVWYAARALAEGFAYQGEPSSYRRGSPRGEASAALPPTAFVNFLQNHDQVGNRAFGERLTALTDPAALAAALAVLLLAPSPPLLFMGEELGSQRPFPFFCDFGADLADAVTEGRRRDLAAFERFAAPEVRRRIPDPNEPATFESAGLDWRRLETPEGRECMALYRRLLDLRRREIAPRLAGAPGGSGRFRLLGDSGLRVRWRLGDESDLVLVANLGDTPVPRPPEPPGARLLYACPAQNAGARELSPWTVHWLLVPGETARPQDSASR
jgi:malto-oligosyltrehalose trehalohydrolase